MHFLNRQIFPLWSVEKLPFELYGYSCKVVLPLHTSCIQMLYQGNQNSAIEGTTWCQCQGVGGLGITHPLIAHR